MRILILVHAFVPEMTAGVELVTHRLAQGLAANHEVAVAYVTNVERDADRLSLGRYDGVPVMRLHARPREEPTARLGLCHPALEGLLMQAVREFEPDLVHVQHTSRSSVNMLWRLQALGLLAVHTLHDFWMMCPRINLFRPDGVLCEGPEGGAACIAAGCYPSTRMYDPYASPAPEVGAPAAPPAPAGRGLLSALVKATPGPLKRALPAGLKHAIVARVSGPQATAAPPSPSAVAPPPPASARDALMMADRAQAFRDCLNLPQRLISPCEHVKRRFVTYGADPERMVVIRNVAGIERLRGIARSRADTPPVFGYIGTLYPHKGAHVLVEAANGMAPGAARFVIAGQGDPSYTARLRGHANNPSIEFVGELPREQVVSFYERIDALVVPSICRESGPLVVQEAIAARRAVIGSDLGGIPEQVTHEVNALLFPPGDARALRSLLERVCREPGQLQALAARLPPPHDPSAYIAEHERLYEQVIRERRL